jgi:hypothetical protein
MGPAVKTGNVKYESYSSILSEYYLNIVWYWHTSLSGKLGILKSYQCLMCLHILFPPIFTRAHETLWFLVQATSCNVLVNGSMVQLE